MVWGDTHLTKIQLRFLMVTIYGFVRVKKTDVGPVLADGFTKLVRDTHVMADKFWRDFYGKMFKGGQSTLYLGDTFWNVNMDGLIDRCVFTHGCSEMINELALDRRSTFVFSMHGNKVFEVSVRHVKRSVLMLELSLKKVLLLKVKMLKAQFGRIKTISKFDTFFSSLLEMEDLKKKFQRELGSQKLKAKAKPSVCL
ncbi:putative transcription factor B3-Domain family [Helianthus annuus]|uniref:Transcription factor B3-Domain family n=1 Tax=Helianthus annuus TaxID=4232 RepID=A0A9K3DHE8_HELAN|nr:putative transcription factor B3-Domain family [Helianthus annuus]